MKNSNKLTNNKSTKSSSTNSKVLIILFVILAIVVSVILIRKFGIGNMNYGFGSNKLNQMLSKTYKIVYNEYGKDCYLVRFYGHIYANGEFNSNKKWYLYFACPKTDRTVLYKYTNEPIFWQIDPFSKRPKLDTSNLLPMSKIGDVILTNCNIDKSQDLQISLNFNKAKQVTYWRVSCKPKNSEGLFLWIDAKSGEVVN